MPQNRVLRAFFDFLGLKMPFFEKFRPFWSHCGVIQPRADALEKGAEKGAGPII